MKREGQVIVLRIPKVLLWIPMLVLGFVVVMIGLGSLQHFLATITGTELRSGLYLTDDQRKELELRWQRARDPGAAARLASYYRAYSWGQEAQWREGLTWTRRAASTGNKALLLSLVTTLTRSSDPNEVAEGIALLEAMLREKDWPPGRPPGELELELGGALKRLEAAIADPHPAGSNFY